MKKCEHCHMSFDESVQSDWCPHDLIADIPKPTTVDDDFALNIVPPEDELSLESPVSEEITVEEFDKAGEDFHKEWDEAPVVAKKVSWSPPTRPQLSDLKVTEQLPPEPDVAKIEAALEERKKAIEAERALADKINRQHAPPSLLKKPVVQERKSGNPRKLFLSFVASICFVMFEACFLYGISVLTATTPQYEQSFTIIFVSMIFFTVFGLVFSKMLLLE